MHDVFSGLCLHHSSHTVMQYSVSCSLNFFLLVISLVWALALVPCACVHVERGWGCTRRRRRSTGCALRGTVLSIECGVSTRRRQQGTSVFSGSASLSN